MKANKVPEKIYILRHEDYSDRRVFNAFTEKESNTDVEYVCKDAFIEKACKFIKEHHYEFSFWNTEEYELGFGTQKFIENFKKYMED